MKAIRRVILALAMAVFIVLAIYADETPDMEVIKTETGKTLVSFTTERPVMLEMLLQNSKGEIFCYKKSDKPESVYKEAVDFSNLQKGKYMLSIIYGNSSVNRELGITKDSILVGSLVRLYEPHFFTEDNMVNISFLNIARKNVLLHIYQNGKYITGMHLGKDMAIQKKLDISNLENGSYKLILTDWFKNHLYVVRR